MEDGAPQRGRNEQDAAEREAALSYNQITSTADRISGADVGKHGRGVRQSLVCAWEEARCRGNQVLEVCTDPADGSDSLG